MYKLCKTEQSALRQHSLEQQLLKMMKTVPFDHITVSDLCSLAGVSRKVFYRYFSGKEGALYGLIDHTLGELDSFPSDTMFISRETYRERMTWFFQFWQRQGQLLEALDNSGISDILAKRVVEYTLSHPDITRTPPMPGGANQQEYSTYFGVSGMMAIVFHWHRSGYRQSPEQLAQVAVELLTKPLIPIV